MEKWLCYAALGVAGLMGLLFLLDLTQVIMPFGGSAFLLVDIFGLLSSLIVAYMGYSALRDVK